MVPVNPAAGKKPDVRRVNGVKCFDIPGAPLSFCAAGPAAHLADTDAIYLRRHCRPAGSPQGPGKPERGAFARKQTSTRVGPTVRTATVLAIESTVVDDCTVSVTESTHGDSKCID